MQTNFQQFVSSNQGKLITFLHNDQRVSKVVVDIQGEYFTGKTNVSDAKIDGFYYFSDCKMVDESHPLISVLEKHRFVLLKDDNWGEIMFEYVEQYYEGRIEGKTLDSNYPNSFMSTAINNVEEVWAMVNGKYTLVYHKPTQEFRNEISLEDVLSSNKDVTIYTPGKAFCNFKFECIDKGLIRGTPSSGVYTGIDVKCVKRVLSKDGKELYVNISDDKEDNATEDSPDIVTKEKNLYKLIQEHHEKFLQLKDILTTYAPKNVGKFIDSIMTIKNGNFTLDKLTYFKQTWEEVKEEYIPFTKSFRTDPKIQALMKRYAELASLICPSNEDTKDLIEKIDKIMIVAGRQEYDRLFKNDNEQVLQKNIPIYIEYRNKPKTIEVVQEYTNKGKEYVLVRDLTDNDKTKTLFKEYIKFL
jgi:hypothetical protein